MTATELIDYWRGIEANNAPKRVEPGPTPRHRLVEQARVILRVLDPEVKVWRWQTQRQETGLVVMSRQRCRLGKYTDHS